MNYKSFLAIVAAALVVVGFSIVAQRPSTVVGSTVVGNDYYSTTTKRFDGTSLANLTVLKSSGGGALARITITGANTGVVRLWDATTTNATLRSAALASSSIPMYEIPASTATGTYEFDVELKYGLIYELVSGNAPTSTILFR